MMKIEKDDKRPFAGTGDQESTYYDVQHVSQPIAKPNVVGSLVGQREIKFRCWDGEKIISPDYINRLGIAYWRENSVPESSTTLMQYTGLKDKNGKEIYEGDILELKYPLSSRDEEDFDDYKLINVAIIFQSGGFWFTGEGFTDCNWHFYNSKDRKIVGNIFDNPELLQAVR